MNDYATPMWQKKKSKCLSRAGFKCEACGDASELLHAHHTAYPKGKKIYEVSDDALVCLCKDCHDNITKAVDCLRKNTLKYLNFSTRHGGGDEVMNCVILSMEVFNAQDKWDRLNDLGIAARDSGAGISNLFDKKYGSEEG